MTVKDIKEKLQEAITYALAKSAEAETEAEVNFIYGYGTAILDIIKFINTNE